VNGTFDISPLLVKLDKLHVLTNTDMRGLIEQQATLFVFSSGKIPGLMNLLPPFSAGRKGKEGLAQGMNKIDSDLAGIFEAVTIKGTRTINHLFGDTNPQGVGKSPPYIVKTIERHPDVQAIYDQRNSHRHGGRLTRGGKAAFYVDREKLNVLRQKLYGRIGWACAAWYKAAVEAGLRPRGVPGWIMRHTSAPGLGVIETTDTSFRITMSSDLKYNDGLEMERKAAVAMSYRLSATERRIPFIVRAAAKKLQLAA
jgi:hypothetical protein